MTIIEPNKHNYFYTQFIYLAVLLVFLAVLSINFYNLNVNFKYNIGAQGKAIQNLETSNADFRNQLYAVLDAQKLAAFAAERNLVAEKNPDYIEHKAIAAR